MAKYNKLVRDRIPEIIERNGGIPQIKTLSGHELHLEATIKLQEEVAEYIEAEDSNAKIHELSDILELIYTLATIHGLTPAELDNVRQKKADINGAFKDAIFLIDVLDKE
jgi:predicted house-cleaning noncanonical NTP pyrophosphatase (MazG superfamily)